MTSKITSLISEKITKQTLNIPCSLKTLIPEDFETSIKENLNEITHILSTSENPLTDFRLSNLKKPYVEALYDFFIKRYIPFEFRMKEANKKTITVYRQKLEYNISKLDRNIVNIESSLNNRLISSCSYFSRTLFDFYIQNVCLSVLLKQEEYKLASLLGEHTFSLELLHDNYTTLVTQSYRFINQTAKDLKEGRLAFMSFKNETSKLYNNSNVSSYNIEYKDDFNSTYPNDTLKQERIHKKTCSTSVYDSFTKIADTIERHSTLLPAWEKEYLTHKNNVLELLDTYEKSTIKPVLHALYIANIHLEKLSSIKVTRKVSSKKAV